MEDFDRASARVTVAGALGALGGVGTAMYKGHPIPRTVGLTAFSCAMVASACFGSERLAATALRGGPLEKELGRGPFLVMTHACGGFLGGGILGYLYIQKPMHGVSFFVPIMSAIGYAESLFQDMVDEQRALQIRKESQL
mgnify:CR=1 FL=1